MNTSFMDFIDKKERDGLATSSPVVAISIDDESDDKELVDNGWRCKNGRWLDPITKSLVSWEVAFALYAERIRTGVYKDCGGGTDGTKTQPIINAYEHRGDSMLNRATAMLEPVGSPSVSGNIRRVNESVGYTPTINEAPKTFATDCGTRVISPTGGLGMVNRAANLI